MTHNPDSRETICLLLDDDALAVLKAGRDAIHAGWQLTHHPLYGNYRPNQQPYRSLILRSPSIKKTEGADRVASEGSLGGRLGDMPVPDAQSLQLMEEALLVYQSCAPLAPRSAPAALREDCAMLDFELMRLPLQQAGIISEFA